MNELNNILDLEEFKMKDYMTNNFMRNEIKLNLVLLKELSQRAVYSNGISEEEYQEFLKELRKFEIKAHEILKND